MSASGRSREPTQRQLRVGELIRRTLADVLMRGETHEPDLAGASITVSEVRVSPDLRQATAYVLPLAGRDVDKVMAGLERARGELRRAVARAVRLRHAPDLRFAVDESFDRMDETRRILADPRVARDLDGGAD